MYLINTSTLKMHLFADPDRVPEYAILSHCWGRNEVSFKEFINNRNRDSSGYKKITECCAFAKNRGREFVWIDTCCIDKRSSAELSEAINSMYEWYGRATECYAYLSDITAHRSSQSRAMTQFERSRWFRRGWTL